MFLTDHDSLWKRFAATNAETFDSFADWARKAPLPEKLGAYFLEKMGTWSELSFRTYKALTARGVQYIAKPLALPEARTVADVFEAARLVPMLEGGRTLQEFKAHIVQHTGGEGFRHCSSSRSKTAPSLHVGGRRRWSEVGYRWRSGAFTSTYAKPVPAVLTWWGEIIGPPGTLGGFEFVDREDGILVIARCDNSISSRWVALLDKGQTMAALMPADDLMTLRAEEVADFAAWEGQTQKPEGAPNVCGDCYVVREADGKMTRHWSQDASQRYMDALGVRSRGVWAESWGFYDGRALLISTFNDDPPPASKAAGIIPPAAPTPAPKGSKAIAPEVLAVLAAAETDGPRLFLKGQLSRPLYEATDKVLKALGGKWNRSAGAHVFEADAGDLLGAVLESGVYVDAKKLLQAFYTPADLAARVIAMADIQPGMTVLEPSAGAGALAIPARAAGGLVTCMDVNAQACAQLEAKGFAAAVGDFLAEPPDAFDRVIMNPPFSGGQDVRHVLHAAQFVRRGGRLVAIMSPGAIHRQTEPFKGFQAWATEHGAQVEHIAAGTFKDSGTDVATIVVVVDL